MILNIMLDTLQNNPMNLIMNYIWITTVLLYMHTVYA